MTLMRPSQKTEFNLTREELLSAADVADVLRVERTTATIYMRRGIVPACKLGRLWYAPQPLLDGFLVELFEPTCGDLHFARDELLTASAVAALLHVGRPTAMTYMRRRTIPAEKIGRLWYSPRAMLNEYLADLFGLNPR